MISEALLVTFGLPSAAAGGYLGMLGLLSGRSATKPPSVPRESLPRLAFVVPAHDEATGIQRTVQSLLAVDYPEDKRLVVVVADNCKDDTASLARQAGARVLERHNLEQRGKGYALLFAFDILMAEGQIDGVVVVDADTVVTANLLTAIGARLATGERVVQAHYGVSNAEDSWRTRLMAFAFTLFHGVRSTARERLGLSTGLRGNGMGFHVSTLREVPYRAYSLAEDVEYALELGLSGIRVAYAEEAEVLGDMVAGAAGSDSQRKRWEDGRRVLLSRYVGPLLTRGLTRRSGLCLDLAMDVLVPPLVSVVLYASLGGAAAAATCALTGASGWALLPWAVGGAGLVLYVAKGLSMSPRGWMTLVDLRHVPRYVLWKLALKVRRSHQPSGEWVRTTRQEQPR